MPQITNPFMATSGIQRNPAFKNKGKFFTLSQFLDFAKAKAVAGVMINIQHASYLAAKKGLDIIEIVTNSLKNATLENQRVFIRSDDTSVLSNFQKIPNYTRVLTVDTKIGDAPMKPLEEIRHHAQAVAIPRASVIKITNYFTTGVTKVVKEMQAANLTVFVFVMRNEYVSLAYDFFSESTMEIATYVDLFHVDGVITEFPKSASRYITCPCRTNLPRNDSYSIMPPEIGSLLDLVPEYAQPPADAPFPPLNVGDIVDPPLPPVSKNATNGGSSKVGGPATGTSSPALSNHLPNLFLSLFCIFMLTLTLLSNSHSAL
ncbi:glycerophosphodiester phosphodiesterase GDPDL6-like [Momordica charantia]|uniref:glycerophosphodiester phosphodiesterase n=1 Tax=Momordica charantia TaxID=3673 RepID=A0A6J1BUG3_MOMCH|nr:glycerophosphodiester phosphodiesterase GDPDL6-like [Momordica charantia]